MIAIGCVLALALWTVAALMLTEFEIVVFVTGVILAAKIGGAW